MSQLKTLSIGLLLAICFIIGIFCVGFNLDEKKEVVTEVVTFHLESDSLNEMTFIKLETVLNAIPEIKCYIIEKECLTVSAMVENAKEHLGFISYRITQLDSLKVIEVNSVISYCLIDAESVRDKLIYLCDVSASNRKISKILR